MILNFNKFAEAVKRAEKFASDAQSSKNLLLEAKGDKLCVSFSDGKKNITERLDCVIEDGDINERAIVTFENIRDIINSCAGSGSITIDTVTFKFDGRDKLIVDADKYYLISKDNENTIKKICSHVNKEIKYTRVDDLRGGTILTRFDYDTIFTTINDSADEWDMSELKELLLRAAKNDPKTCFFSGAKQAAYSMTQASLTLIPFKEEISNGFSLNSKVAKSLGDIIGSLSGTDNKLLVYTVDKKFCYMMTSDETLGIMFELAQATRNDVTSLQRYTSATYDTYSFVFVKDALADTLKTALAAAKDDNSVLNFRLGTEKLDGAESDREELQCVIDRGNVASSISKLVVGAVSYTDSEEDSLLNTHINLNLKVLMDIMNNCIKRFVKFDLLKNQNSVMIQISDCDKNEDGAIEVSAFHYTACTLS